MTYQPSPYTQPPTFPQPPAPAKTSHTKLVVILVSVGAALVLLVGGILYAAGTFGGGLSKESAQRACRTAFGNEYEKRAAGAAGKSTDIVATMNNIEVEETWESDGGWSVNGTVHYTMTTALVAPVESTINLTCVATGSDDAPTTTVTNRS